MSHFILTQGQCIYMYCYTKYHYAAMGNSCVLLVSCNLNKHVRCILYQYLPVHFNWHNAMAGFLLGFTIYI